MYPGRNFPPRRQNRRENVNESIRAREVRAVFPDGTTEVMCQIAAMLPPEYRGVYADHPRLKELLAAARLPAGQPA